MPNLKKAIITAMATTTLHIIHIISSGGLYGAEQVLLNLCRHQVLLGHTVQVALLQKTDNGHNALKMALANINIKSFDIQLGKKSLFTGGNRLIRLAQQKQASILHSHGYLTDIMLALRSYRPKSIVCVSTFHGWNNEASRLNKRWWYEQINAKTAIGLDQVIAVTETLRLDPKLPTAIRENLQIIHNGIEFSTPKVPYDPEVQQFCDQHYVFCAIGRLVEVKGVDILLEAFANLISRQPQCRLLIIGDGKRRQALLEQANQLELSNKQVMFAGFKPAAANYLSLIDCLVMPSRSEGLPITILEAMHAEIPIIASLVGEIPQLLADNRGVLVTSEHIDELTSAMETMINNPAKKVYANREYVNAHYSAEKMARDYCALYISLLANK